MLSMIHFMLVINRSGLRYLVGIDYLDIIYHPEKESREKLSYK